MRRFDVVALDADDTLWHNETHFHATHAAFRDLLAAHADPAAVDAQLDATERRNLSHFGYGVKGFTLSMIETAVELTDGRITAKEIQQLIDFGRAMLAKPIELLDGVAETIDELADHYRLVLVTKGDLFDQETKLARSGLGDKFSAVEVVSEKDERTYRGVIRRLGVPADRFLMAGNSVKSDVLPVLAAGGAAVHIPYPLLWGHERVDIPAGVTFPELARLRDLPGWLRA